MFPIISGSTPQPAGNKEGLFAFGGSPYNNNRNLISNAGVVAADASGAGTARNDLGACEYGDDKGIMAFGSGKVNMSNLVSNTGVVSADGTGVGTGRYDTGGAS